jgi:hypothetical protein
LSINQSTISFKLKDVKIKNISLLPQAINEWNLYESICTPGITGDISISDYQGFMEVGEIFAMDDIEFIFSTDGREELKLKYKIYASSTKVIPTATYHPVSYSFCSPWMIEATIRPVSKVYKEKYIHEIIQDLLLECGASIGFIEPTKQKLHRFTTPLWTPLKSIYYFLSFALNKNDRGGYTIWTDMKTGKVNVCTIDYLFAGKYGKEDKKFMSLPQNEFYESRIISLNLENNFDVIKYVNAGIGKTIHQSFFYDKNKLISSENSVNEFPYTHLGSKLPINNYFKDRKYATIKGNYLYPTKDGLVQDDNELRDMVEGKVQSHYVKLFSDIFKINILTNPNSSRRVGNLAPLEYQSEDKTKVMQNQQLSGDYLIRSIRHACFNGVSQDVCTLVSDGFFKSNNDLITW